MQDITKKLFQMDLVFQIHDVKKNMQKGFEVKFLQLVADNKIEAYQKALITASNEVQSSNKKECILEFIGLDNFKELVEAREILSEYSTLQPSENASEYIQKLKKQNNLLQLELSRTS